MSVDGNVIQRLSFARTRQSNSSIVGSSDQHGHTKDFFYFCCFCVFTPLSQALSLYLRRSVYFLEMDWQGQKLSEQLMQIILLTFAVLAFVSGYVTLSFQLMILIYAGGVVLTTLITVPNWPFFNRHPLNWLDSGEAEKHPKPQKAVNANKKSAKK
ncbi:Microsomal signal peptidase 12 kDa subunit (SPC12) [Tripterygium wilfordii]|uniref:Signal peptidase complex subunit 1 n=1 Tax=Tripterygium wilfordii TaxID=458696 RepID=A0A7J7DJC8_TRIWF|nr:probable signal peptidase complex subunit 1 [Tripterygium wilfordii]KAF5746451.1 Microsomal signal peptidase 12 kDa subunit (SPC12) [Tripterygium wilfordii]